MFKTPDRIREGGKSYKNGDANYFDYYARTFHPYILK